MTSWRTIFEGLSWLVGWIYFAAWTASFYPQLLKNRRRQSVRGVAQSFFPINVLGFACYTTSSVLLLFSPVIRSEYAARHPAAPEPTIRLNDLAFAAHALVVASITWSQFFPAIWGYRPCRKSERVTMQFWGVSLGCVLAILVVMVLAVVDEKKFEKRQERHPDVDLLQKGWQFLDVTTTMALAKVLISLVKWLPQAVLNYRTKKIDGFSINQIILDLIGGVLSLLQLGIDSALEGSWDGVKGNLVKLGLGVGALIFDVLFLMQRYVWYKDASTDENDKDGVDDGESDDDEEDSDETDRERRRGTGERQALLGGR